MLRKYSVHKYLLIISETIKTHTWKRATSKTLRSRNDLLEGMALPIETQSLRGRLSLLVYKTL